MSVDDHDAPSESLDRASGDLLSDVLDTVRLQGTLFFLWEPTWPYAMGVADGRELSRCVLPESDCMVSYHIVTRGPCWAAVQDEAPIRLDTGDTLVLPRGDAYRIASSPSHPEASDSGPSIAFFRQMADGLLPTVIGGGGPGPGHNALICGFLGCSPGPFNPLLSSLPRMIRVPAPASDRDPLGVLVDFALSESGQRQGGERSLLVRLGELMFIEVLRRYLRSADAGTSLPGWLGALGDPSVGRALSLLHGDVSRRWTVQALADACGLSRSTLAQRFTARIGLPPMQYLTRWRMQLAADALRQGSDKLYAIASDIGYESEEAFSRAFRRELGMTPSEWRLTRETPRWSDRFRNSESIR